MVYKVAIRDNKKTPLYYLTELDNFKNGKEYNFTSGVNIVVGENGCGKTTLMNLIKCYLLVYYTECSRGMYNSNINRLYGSKGFLDGVDVYADYHRNTFRLSHAGEKEKNQVLDTFEDFGTMFNQKHASTGEGVVIAMQSLFKHIFSDKVQLTFDYSQFKEGYYGEYGKYIESHRKDSDEWVILMDEPDRNLSLENLQQIKGILNFHKPETQIIAVVHNPLLIYNLSKVKDVNIIEMTEGYVNKTINLINKLIK